MRPLLLLSLCTMLAAPALADTCVHRNDIRSWKSGPHQTLTLENGARQKVTLRLSSGCDRVTIYDGIAITSLLGANFSCVALGDQVVTQWAGERGVCHVVALTPIAPPQ